MVKHSNSNQKTSSTHLPPILKASKDNPVFFAKSCDSNESLIFPSVATALSFSSSPPNCNWLVKVKKSAKRLELNALKKYLDKSSGAIDSKVKHSSKQVSELSSSLPSCKRRRKLFGIYSKLVKESKQTIKAEVSSYSHESKSKSQQWNERMHSRHQNKRGSQQTDRTLRVAEHRSFANLASSFDVPNVGHVTVPGKTRLRITKSFHGEISEVGARSSQDGGKGHVTNGGSHSSMLSNGFTLLRQHQSSPYRKMPDRQKSKVLRPLNVSKNQNNSNKICELGQELPSAYLPEQATGSFRLTHDVSFDEGSRYRNSSNSAHTAYKAVEDAKEVSRRKKANSSSNDDQRPSHYTSRFELLNDQSNRRPPTSHVQTLTFKDPTNYSFLRMEDKRQTTRGLSPHGGLGSPTYMRTTSPNLMMSLRGNKDPMKSWNSKFGDLSISGGGFCGSNPIQPGARAEHSNGGVASLSVNSSSSYAPKVTFRALSRDKSVVSGSRPRHSSRSRTDPTSSHGILSKDPIYSDPFVGAPPSFQQRINELSILETETIKYEKSRKFKRKPKADKDS